MLCLQFLLIAFAIDFLRSFWHLGELGFAVVVRVEARDLCSGLLDTDLELLGVLDAFLNSLLLLSLQLLLLDDLQLFRLFKINLFARHAMLTLQMLVLRNCFLVTFNVTSQYLAAYMTSWATLSRVFKTRLVLEVLIFLEFKVNFRLKSKGLDIIQPRFVHQRVILIVLFLGSTRFRQLLLSLKLPFFFSGWFFG